MKLVTISSLLTLVILAGCETSQKQTDSFGLNKGIDTQTRETNHVAAAEKRLALGLGYVRKGLFERAKKNLLAAEKHAPEMPDVMFGLAYYYQNVMELDTSEAYYKRALKKAPNNPDYLNAYGAFLCKSRQDYDGAVKYFLKAVNKPEYTAVAESYENAGFCSLEGGNHEKAGIYFNKAITFNPRLSRPIYGLAKMAFESGQYNKAESYLFRFEGKSKPTPDSLLLGYKIGRRLNDRFSMESYGEKLIQLFPNTEQASMFKRMSS